MKLWYIKAKVYSTKKKRKSYRFDLHFIQGDDDISDHIHVLIVEHEVESLCVPIGFYHRRAQVVEL
jgi:hypothetical protein